MNRVKAAPLYVTMEHLEDGTAWGVAANSGNANACCPMSHEYAEEMARLAARATGRAPADFVVASTGVIAVMTTDTVKKELALACSIGGRTVTLGAIAKGSGMIHPNMGTMLCFITTDCAITHEMLAEALHSVVVPKRTFNRVTVDGDTSTNDMCLALANGMAGNPLIEWKDEDYSAFYAARDAVHQPGRQIAADGEGASRLVSCTVTGARGEDVAERLAKAVVGSPLVKAAMFGADANWGRVLCAMGYLQGPLPSRARQLQLPFRRRGDPGMQGRRGAGL